MVTISKGDVSLWNVKKSKLYRIVAVHIRAATEGEYAVSV